MPRAATLCVSVLEYKTYRNFHHHHHHHHHQVARSAVSIAVSTTERHLERSCARSHAELRPRLVGCRSSSMVRSQVRRGRPPAAPVGWKTVDGCLKGTGMILGWISSCDMSEQIVEVTGDCLVLRLTSSFVTWAVYGIRNIRRKHHWLKAFRRRLMATVILYVSAAYKRIGSTVCRHYKVGPWSANW